MSFSFNLKKKAGHLIASFFFIMMIDIIRYAISVWQHSFTQTNACIDDPLHDLLSPLSKALADRVFLRKVLLAVDSVLIDSTIVVLGGFWAMRGRTKSFIPSLIVFYAVRSIILNTAKWPLPRLYLFGDPGIPSFFVDYDQTNDLFFSGHCGGITVMLTDCLLNKRRVWAVFLFLLLGYTFFVLTAERGHYTNDMIVGIIAGFTINRIYFEYKEAAALCYMRKWGTWLTAFKSVVLLFSVHKDLKANIKDKGEEAASDHSSIADIFKDSECSEMRTSTNNSSE